MKKKICIVGPAYPYRGGNALFVAHLYSALENQFDVNVINYTRLYPQILFPGTRQEDVSKVGIKVHPSERIIDSINPFSWRKAIKRIKELKPDLIAFIWYQPYFGLCLGKIAKEVRKEFPGKVLFITENIISHEARFYDYYLTQRALKSADKFLVLSDIVEKGIKHFYPDIPLYKSKLPIYDCYKFDDKLTQEQIRTKIKLPQDKKIILFFGYIREYKGLEFLIKAMPKILEKCKDAYLLIVGEFYDKSEKYYNLVNQLKIEDSVKFIPEFVPNEDIGLYYTSSDLVVLPYNSATQSGVLNIAYGFKKPVVVTNVGGLPELVEEGKTGFIAEPKNPDSIAENVLKYFYIQNKQEIIKNIELYVERNSFNSIIKVFNQIINN